MRILLDMDEVLCDFVGGALAVHGWTRPQWEAVHPIGTWDMVAPMGLTQEQFWRKIQQEGVSFWRSLEPLSWAQQVVDWARSLTNDWYVVTNPGKSDAACLGKIKWLKDHFGYQFERYVVTPSKEVLACPNTMLVDDREQTLVEFSMAGGLIGLFPSRHNVLHKYADDPMAYLKQPLLTIKERIDAIQVSQRK